MFKYLLDQGMHSGQSLEEVYWIRIPPQMLETYSRRARVRNRAVCIILIIIKIVLGPFAAQRHILLTLNPKVITGSFGEVMYASGRLDRLIWTRGALYWVR